MFSCFGSCLAEVGSRGAAATGGIFQDVKYVTNENTQSLCEGY